MVFHPLEKEGQLSYPYPHPRWVKKQISSLQEQRELGKLPGGKNNKAVKLSEAGWVQGLVKSDSASASQLWVRLLAIKSS